MVQDRENWLVSYPDDGNEVCYALEDSSFWYQHRNECIVSAAREFGFAKQFYDIGGGNGVTAQALQRAGYDVTLVEPYRAGIENARRRGIQKTVLSTLEDYRPDPTASIESVGFFDVMEHVADDRDFLRKINKLLPSDGKIMFTVPAFSALWSDNDVQLGHFRRYNLGQIDELLRETGFEPVHKTYFFALAWLPMWLLRVLPNRIGIRQQNTPSKKKSEHMADRPVWAKILRKLMSWEIGFIKGRRVIPCGTSCLVIARKKRNP